MNDNQEGDPTTGNAFFFCGFSMLRSKKTYT